MRRLFLLAAMLALAAALVPLALGESSHNKPVDGHCPNGQYTDTPISSLPSDQRSVAALDDINDNGVVCVKTVAGRSNADVSGPLYIDDTAHNQNG